ncbi:MAG: AI-2E family transporter [Alphaproteobacteria bacterium]|nr:AI-2E family transporter [Alphaproteobacteria bacterium]
MTTRQQLGYWLATLVVSLVALYLLRGILLPFIAGAAVAYFLDPATDRLETWRLPRSLASAIMLTLFFVLALLAALLIVPVLQRQVVGLAQHMPNYLAQLRDNALPAVIELAQAFGIDYQADDLRQTMGDLATDAVGFFGRLLKGVWAGGLAVVNVLSLLFITPIVAFYLLRDWDLMTARLDTWLPRQHGGTIRQLLTEIDGVMAGFVRGQGTVCLILGTFYALALTLAGLDFGLIIGIIAGLVSFIPFVGAIVGLVLSLTQALMQFWPDFIQIGIVVAIFVAGQFLEGNFLTPRLLGDRVGLHPVWVMFGLLAGGTLFGFVGVLIAVPVTAAIGVVSRFFHDRYMQSRLYLGPDGDANADSDPDSE